MRAARAPGLQDHSKSRQIVGNQASQEGKTFNVAAGEPSLVSSSNPVPLLAEVISIGDELTNGQRLDTNSQWLSQQLGDLGIATLRHTTVGDDLGQNIEALRQAAGRAEVVICTGGLGPTLDDLTRQAMAEAFDRPLQLDASSLEHIQQMFRQRGREMPERNRSQAMFPAGSQTIPNPHGSAPGIDLAVPCPASKSGRASRLFALPGVPAEMKQMWRETVLLRIEQMLSSGQGPLRYHVLKVFGIGESDVEVKLPDLIDRQRIPTVGITVSRATITLRIACRARTDDEFQQAIAATVAEIRQALGDMVFAEGNVDLEHVVTQQLRQRNLSLACIEIGAASWISDWMLSAADGTHQGEVTAPAEQFAGGIAFPTLAQARHWLAETPPARATDATSAESPDGAPTPSDEPWRSLARQTCERFKTDIGLVVGTYPFASEMEAGHRAFDFVFACGWNDQVHIERRQMGGHPDVLGPRAAKTGLDIVRRQLMLSPLPTTDSPRLDREESARG